MLTQKTVAFHPVVYALSFQAYSIVRRKTVACLSKEINQATMFLFQVAYLMFLFLRIWMRLCLWLVVCIRLSGYCRNCNFHTFKLSETKFKSKLKSHIFIEFKVKFYTDKLMHKRERIHMWNAKSDTLE